MLLCPNKRYQNPLSVEIMEGAQICLEQRNSCWLISFPKHDSDATLFRVSQEKCMPSITVSTINSETLYFADCESAECRSENFLVLNER